MSPYSIELVGIRGCAKHLMTFISVPYYVCKLLVFKGLQKDLTGFLGLLWLAGSFSAVAVDARWLDAPLKGAQCRRSLVAVVPFGKGTLLD